MQNENDRKYAIQMALKDIPRRHKLHKAVAEIGGEEVPQALFDQICATADGSPIALSWRVRMAATRALGAVNLTAEQQTAAMALLVRETQANRLLRPAILQLLIVCGVIALVGGTLFAMFGLPASDESPITKAGQILTFTLFLPFGAMPLVGPFFALVQQHRWDDLREAAWETLGRFSRPEAVAPLASACFNYGPKARCAAIASLATVVESLDDNALERAELTDLSPVYRLLMAEPGRALVWLRILNIHGTGSSLAPVTQFIRALSPSNYFREKAGEVSAVLAARLANETARSTLLRGSAPSSNAAESLLRAAAPGPGEQDDLLIAAEAPNEVVSG